MSRYLIPLLVPVACAAPDVTTTPVPPLVEAADESPARVPELPMVEDAPSRRRQLERDLIRAAREHDYVRARAMVEQLEELEIQPLVDEARALLVTGDAAGALAVVERALEVAPDGPSTRLLHGQAALQVGRNTWDDALIEAALASFQAAATQPPRGGVDGSYRRGFAVHAFKGAAEAAHSLGRKEQALEFATLELDYALGHDDRRELYAELDEWPERTFVQACYDFYVDVRESDPKRAAELVSDMDTRLSWLMNNRPRDPWAWSMLASVWLREERFQDAVDAAVGGLGRRPDDRTLPGQLAEAARGVGGSDEVLVVFERLKERQPRAALAWWYPAFERFDRAVAALAEEPIEELQRAEADFRRCRELELEYARECLGFEAMCRDAVGWVLYRQGELEAAEAAFRSMEELFPRAMTWQIKDRLFSGVQGLRFVADGYSNRDDLFAAARIFLELHEYDPTDADLANNAGYFNREAGTRMETYADDATAMVSGDLKSEERRARIVEAAGLPVPADATDEEWRALMKRASDPLRQRSREMFETSYESYLAAVELAPEDVRIINDTALIAVHHLSRDLERAEAYLLRCVELGGAQLDETAEMEEEARTALTEAWGDAHENLGVLHLNFRDDPRTARQWFEQALEIGPNVRPVITELYLPRCDEMLSKR
jgi:tetratricopeptide (TPR) repeat protein